MVSHSYLCLQGEEADCFYIVESGEVKIMIKSKVRTVSSIMKRVDVTVLLLLFYLCIRLVVASPA